LDERLSAVQIDATSRSLHVRSPTKRLTLFLQDDALELPDSAVTIKPVTHVVFDQSGPAPRAVPPRAGLDLLPPNLVLYEELVACPMRPAAHSSTNSCSAIAVQRTS